jgi:plastocyanin
VTAKVAVLAVALGLLASSGPASAGPAAKPKTHTVTIEGTRFEPANLTVAPGDVIVWVNKDPFPHTVTSKAGRFDSGAIAPDASWKLVARRQRGELPYVCTYHPTMTGTLRVK